MKDVIAMVARPGFLVAAVLVNAMIGGPSAAAKESFKVATQNSPPLTMIDDQGRISGFDVEVARALCAVMNVGCDIDAMPFAEVLNALDSGAADVAVASMLITPERQKKYLFTERYWRSTSSFVGKTGAWPTGEAPSLAGRRVAVLRGSKQADFIHRQPGTGEILLTATQGEALRAVAEGRADLFLTPSIYVLPLLSGDGGQELETVGDPLVEGGLGGDVGIALPRGKEALRDRINQALRAILANGTYDAISSRFLPFRMY